MQKISRTYVNPDWYKYKSNLVEGIQFSSQYPRNEQIIKKMNPSTILFCLAITVAAVAGDCWWTADCQPDSWQTKGCAQYGRTENGTEACPGGKKYYCCTPPPGSSTGMATGKRPLLK